MKIVSVFLFGDRHRLYLCDANGKIIRRIKIGSDLHNLLKEGIKIELF